jgi:hypothetical protein
LRIGAQSFAHTQREQARVLKTLVPQCFLHADEFSARVLRAPAPASTLQPARIGTLRTATTAAARAVHDSLSGVAVFLIVL